MKISVIVPVYNVERYVRCSLDSVLSQTYSDWECVCVDDGSTDGSGAVLDEYAARDARFRVVHQENAGVSAARNRGMTEAAGELVAFLDSDDTFDPCALEVMAKAFGETGAELLRYRCRTVRSHADDRAVTAIPDYAELDVNGLSESPLRHCALGAASAVSRRLAKIVRWPSLTQCEDPLFVLRCMAQATRTVEIDGELVNYLVRRSSASRSVSLSIVKATCDYLVMAYDGCAALPGFAKSRLDTCRFLAGFLTGPLAHCGKDVPPADAKAAETSVAGSRSALEFRDPLFRILAGGSERFDFVFSLGAACSGTETLRAAGLQYASFPFDWLLGPGPADRVKMMAGEFSGWMDSAEDFEEISNPDAFRHAPWRNRRTGYSYMHDFDQGVPLAEQLPAVREKYARRIDRLLKLVRRSRRVLVVWTGDPRDGIRLSEGEIGACLEMLRTKFPGVEFRMFVFECVSGIPHSDPEVSCSSESVRVAFDYRVPDAGNDWAIRQELLLPYLARYSVADYRTPELRRAHARAERARDRERFPSKTYAGYLMTKFMFKLYKHLKKTLERRGVWME